jgi:acyl-CoA thioesterase YciA
MNHNQKAPIQLKQITIGKEVDNTMQLLTTHPVKKSDLGTHGNLFGGNLLSWVDSAIAAYAMEMCHSKNMVTVSIDKCEFKKPAKEGTLVKIYAKLSKVGTTSAQFDVEARNYNVFTEEEVCILSTHMTFVRIDDEGGPIPISETVRRKFNSPNEKV